VHNSFLGETISNTLAGTSSMASAVSENIHHRSRKKLYVHIGILRPWALKNCRRLPCQIPNFQALQNCRRLPCQIPSSRALNNCRRLPCQILSPRALKNCRRLPCQIPSP
jgi:hypothetical protein